MLFYFVGWFFCYFVLNILFECYFDFSVIFLYIINNFYFEKNLVYFLWKIILVIIYLIIELNFFFIGIFNMFVLCRNYYCIDCIRCWFLVF